MNSTDETLNFLAVGDIVGNEACRYFISVLPEFQKKEKIFFTIVNGENSFKGYGISLKQAEQLLDSGVDVLTGGNHMYDSRDIIPLFNSEQRMIRPANYVDEIPGQGYVIAEKRGIPVLVINAIGRIFMEPTNNPFNTVSDILQKCRKEVLIRIIDFHAEATAEKQAFAWYLDGRASLIFGTHTHVQTADERILPAGPGFITDLGMTGVINSVIGMDVHNAVKKFLTTFPKRVKIAEGEIRAQGIIAAISPQTGACRSIRRVFF